MSLIANLPPHAKTLHRSVSATGTIFTVPAGQTLYLNSVTATFIAGASGNLTVEMVSEDVGTNQVILNVPASAAAQVLSPSISGFNLRLTGGSSVSLVLTGGAGSTVAASIIGWLDRGA